MTLPRLTAAQRRQVYGQPGDTSVHVMVTTPWGLKVRCHRLIAARLVVACRAAAQASAWKPYRVDSYANRAVRGSTSTSLHAHALALDFFDKPYPLQVDVWGPTNAPDIVFLQVFKGHGFTLGRDFTSRQDWPHIEWAAAPPVGDPVAIPGVAPPIPVPLVKPITFTRLGEAAGMRISTTLIDIPALDAEGRGWVDVPFPLERVVSVVGHGSSPPNDGYWPTLVCTVQPRGASTRVTLAGRVGQHVGIWVKILEET